MSDPQVNPFDPPPQETGDAVAGATRVEDGEKLQDVADATNPEYEKTGIKYENWLTPWRRCELCKQRKVR